MEGPTRMLADLILIIQPIFCASFITKLQTLFQAEYKNSILVRVGYPKKDILGQ